MVWRFGTLDLASYNLVNYLESFGALESSANGQQDMVCCTVGGKHRRDFGNPISLRVHQEDKVGKRRKIKVGLID